MRRTFSATAKVDNNGVVFVNYLGVGKRCLDVFYGLVDPVYVKRCGFQQNAVCVLRVISRYLAVRRGWLNGLDQLFVF